VNHSFHPEAWQIVEDDVRRYLIKRFPFGVYHSIEGDRVMIYAVLHMSRNPEFRRSRMKGR
jgi:toxin ParE1/3/4